MLPKTFSLVADFRSGLTRRVVITILAIMLVLAASSHPVTVAECGPGVCPCPSVHC